jgi:DNA-binding transcriptional regulator YdaS (Cro superfamily)
MRAVPFARKREGAYMASALGLEAAALRLGISSSRLCQWRKDVEAVTGERLPRKYHWRARRPKILSATQEAELRARRKRGVSWGVLARIYGVSVGTCRRTCGEDMKGRAA